MQVRVLFFGMLKDIFLEESQSMELPAGARVSTLMDQCRQKAALHRQQDSASDAGSIWNSVAVAVNRQYVPLDHELQDGDEVALLPPVSGGTDRTDHDETWLTRDAIPVDAILARAARPEDGAVVVFDGIVRDNTRGRRTLYLDYEAYEDMAHTQLKQLAAQAKQRFAVHGITIVHRLGRLFVGETSVLIVVASAHRAAAFDACRWVIDTLKTTVPIWKKECFEDGAVWAAGEPFPAPLRAGEAV